MFVNVAEQREMSSSLISLYLFLPLVYKADLTFIKIKVSIGGGSHLSF